MNLLQLFFILFIAFNAIVIGTAEPQLEDIVDTTCHTAADCEVYRWLDKNVTCEDGKCVCDRADDGTRIECIVNPIVGRVNNVIAGNCPCDQIANSKCDSKQNVCLCRNGFVASSNRRRCLKEDVQLNETCENNGQCLQNDKFSFCESDTKKCQCQLHFVEHEGVCIGSVALKHTCVNDTQCIANTPNSKCISHKCLCDKNYVPSSIHNKCLPAAGYKQACEETYQCRGKLGIGSECYSGLCTCDSGHELIKDKEVENEYFCERRVMIDDICHEHNECYQFHLGADEQGMECIEGVCKCRSNFRNKNNVCVHSSKSKILFNTMLLMVVLAILKI